jgi:hypothetical protein
MRSGGTGQLTHNTLKLQILVLGRHSHVGVKLDQNVIAQSYYMLVRKGLTGRHSAHGKIKCRALQRA